MTWVPPPPPLSAPAAMASPLPMVTVVGPQFCAPYVVALTITKKALSLSDSDFIVSDVNGTVLMKVEGRVPSLHSRRVLCDAAGIPILWMREKRMSMHHRWNVYRGGGGGGGDCSVLFTVKKSHVLQLKTELEVYLAGNTGEQCCDFKVKGSWFDRSCTFYLGDTNTIVALMSREYQVQNENVVLGRGTGRGSRDSFGVTVYPNVDHAFIVAIIVVLDQIHRDHRDHRDHAPPPPPPPPPRD